MGYEMTRPYYIQIERQGNLLGIIKVEAFTYEEAEYKALKALHGCDDISETTEENARASVESGELDIILDENGDEVDLDEEDEENSLPTQVEIHRPGSIDDEDEMDIYIRNYLETEYGHKVSSFYMEFDATRIYISNIEWGEDEEDDD